MKFILFINYIINKPTPAPCGVGGVWLFFLQKNYKIAEKKNIYIYMEIVYIK